MKLQCYLSKDLLVLCQLQDHSGLTSLKVCHLTASLFLKGNCLHNVIQQIEIICIWFRVLHCLLWKYNPNPLINVNSCFAFEQIGPL